ncbi:tetratricopeptide repeat protein [Mahella australiensis]|uniref:Tetratricopeptide TPR_1 repeat-containing protein n=1 Tax=Mahella australiensis (strain DSM 15567 / CIP 107919 / 50-1 BON) TaxID=697281 RepID=F3ZX48_MAHA5|nr:tetratricopeptide repeat protein [Mahella australiensis]AEE95497.1 Tetratricopeptide TPR_1 repeat-containing protein [Mahella australiensis 50-1 BON]
MIYTKPNEGNVLPFEQNGSFYYKRAQKYIGKSNYIEALNCYRKAVDKDPDNIGYVLELAELFTEMSFFDESNVVLAHVLHRAGEYRARVYFDMACNFLGMQDYDQAREYFKKYLNMDYDGEYADEAEEFLAILELQTSYIEEIIGYDSSFKALYKRARIGKQLLDKGEYKKAINVFERIMDEDPTLLFVKNNLSLAYFCAGDIDKAINIEKAVLSVQSDNIHANCNMALYYDDIGNQDGKEEYIKRITDLIDADDPDGLYKIGVTLCELGLHDRALDVLKMLLEYNPYDIRIIYYCGVACLNLKQYDEAMDWWDKMLKLDPDNSIAAFYRARTSLHMRQLIPDQEYLYQYQVPHDEFLRRMQFINRMLAMPEDQLIDMWHKDKEFKDIIRWGLDINDDVIKSVLLHTVSGFRDREAERILREFLLRKGESEALRKEVFGLLKQNGIKEPYMAYIDQRLTEVKVNLITETENSSLRSLYMETAELAVEMMKNRYDDNYEAAVRKTMECYLNMVSQERLSKIRKKEVWAAALEYYYCRRKGSWGVMRDIAQYYNVSASSLSTAYRRLIDTIGYIDF